MVEDLFHLLARHHLLHEAIDPSQLCLLPLEIFPAPAAVEADKGEHQRQEDDHDHGQAET